MPTVKLSPVFNDQTSTAAGAPAVGYKIYTYAAGSTTPQATYTDSTGDTEQQNPITLDANGYPEDGPIWLQSGILYKFILKDADGVQVGQPFDDISGINDTSSGTSQWISSGATPTYVSAKSFTLSGDQTADFHVGRRLQFSVTAGTVYGTIVTSSYSSSTTVTMAMDSTGSLDSGLSSVNLSILRADNPALPYLSVAGVQKLINGGAEVAQRAAASLSTTAAYGKVDRCAMWASSGSVSAGTVTQTTSSSAGRTGYAARASGVTLTGTAVLSWRYRMESRDAIKLKNQAGSFQINVWHDVGSTINYTVIVRKPTAADNYTSTSTISTSSAFAVPTSTATAIAFSNITLGDVSNGIEIEVQAACGAITTKNFDFTEWQLQEGSSVTPFERRDFDTELRKCQRYYEKSYDASIYPGDTSSNINGAARVISRAADQNDRFVVAFKATKRASPTCTVYAPTAGNSGFWTSDTNGSSLTATAQGQGLNGFASLPTANTTSATRYTFHWTADAEL